ncbi:hypothetical protein ACFE04_024157 [Oxalis oulophora]
MGNICASTTQGTTSRKRVGGGGGGGGYDLLNWPKVGKIIHYDGRLQEFHRPIKAGHVLSLHANCFLCSIESMDIDSHVPHVPIDEDLQLGQIYFLMPQSIHQSPLSLHQLCSLAVKAAASLGDHINVNVDNNNNNNNNNNNVETCSIINIPFGYNYNNIVIVGNRL